MRKSVFILFFLAFVYFGCDDDYDKKHHSPSYGVDFNSVREKLGIALLSSTWTLEEPIGDDKIIWHNTNTYNARPRHVSKTVLYPGGTLLGETDLYSHPRTYRTQDSVYNESLSVTFYYRWYTIQLGVKARSRKIDIVGWHCVYNHGDGQNGCEMESVTKAQADSIVLSWGITDSIKK